MNKNEAIKIIGILAANYERFERLSKDKTSAEILVDTWTSSFSDIDFKTVATAIQSFILTHSTTPTIADIRKECLKIQGEKSLDEEVIPELWNEFLKITSDTYRASENLQKASKPIKEFLGRDISLAVRAIQDYGMMDSNEIKTVVYGLFLKQMPVILKRLNYERFLTRNLKNTIRVIQKGRNLVLIEKV